MTRIITAILFLIVVCSCNNDGNWKVIEGNKKITINPENSTMSDHKLFIIPTNPKFSPNEKQITESLKFLEDEYPSLTIESEILDNVEFMDCGQNFETVNCNLCGEDMDIEFWQELMSNSYENTNFNELEFITICCNKKTSLNDLKYNGDCGFSSYYLSIDNPEPDEHKEALIAKRISNILGADVKLFWSHI
jgi:hypothetical protein